MPATLLVRDATFSDIAFLVDSNAAMAWETERKVLDRAVLERGIAAVLESRSRGFYLIAERNGVLVGCLLMTNEWSDWRNGWWWWVQSVHVVPEARRVGVFRRLHGEVERRAREASDVIGLRLYVDRDNARAQATYAALGLAETAYRLYECEWPIGVERTPP